MKTSRRLLPTILKWLRGVCVCTRVYIYNVHVGMLHVYTYISECVYLYIITSSELMISSSIRSWRVLAELAPGCRMLGSNLLDKRSYIPQERWETSLMIKLLCTEAETHKQVRSRNAGVWFPCYQGNVIFLVFIEK